MAYNHNTIRAYTLALLNVFNDLCIQYKNSNGDLITVNIPIHYKNVEKSTLMNMSEQQIISGNMNVLPRAYLVLNSLSKDPDRQTSKLNKVSRFRNGETQEYAYQSVAYLFEYSVVILCRGMSETAQILEEVCPKFNPNISIDVYDRKNLDEAYRAVIQLNSASFEIEEFEELSINLSRVTFDLTLAGFLHEPIQEYSQVLKYNINLHTPDVNEVDKMIVENDLVQPGYEFESDGNVEDGEVRTGETNESDYFTATLSDLKINSLTKTIIDDNNLQISIDYRCSRTPKIDFQIITSSDKVEISVDDEDINSVYVFGTKNTSFTVQAKLTDGECIRYIQQTFRI